MEITNMWEGFNAKGNNSGYRGNTGSRDVIAGHVILKEKTVQEMTSGVRRAVHILQWGKKKPGMMTGKKFRRVHVGNVIFK